RGCSIRSMAKQLGHHPSTISREIKRNRGKRGYHLNQADRKARERRSIASQAPSKMTAALVAKIQEAIGAKWSPEQIGIRLKEKGILKRGQFRNLLILVPVHYLLLLKGGGKRGQFRNLLILVPVHYLLLLKGGGP
ncbi:MAG: helix-turn-helix domain-containing protein, partial [Verrucomicrobiae bacterium]|nr:helix-turn-helix domain-containing protein [Verrucomicrobiae bacterium]